MALAEAEIVLVVTEDSEIEMLLETMLADVDSDVDTRFELIPAGEYEDVDTLLDEDMEFDKLLEVMLPLDGIDIDMLVEVVPGEVEADMDIELDVLEEEFMKPGPPTNIAPHTLLALVVPVV